MPLPVIAWAAAAAAAALAGGAWAWLFGRGPVTGGRSLPPAVALPPLGVALKIGSPIIGRTTIEAPKISAARLPALLNAECPASLLK